MQCDFRALGLGWRVTAHSGRSARLLASLTLELDKEGILDQIPAQVRRHLDSAVLVHDKQRRDLAYDTGKIRQALDSIGVKLVLLKGAGEFSC